MADFLPTDLYHDKHGRMHYTTGSFAIVSGVAKQINTGLRHVTFWNVSCIATGNDVSGVYWYNTKSTNFGDFPGFVNVASGLATGTYIFEAYD